MTPYARQAEKIRLALSSQGISGLQVGSVETFQGQERRGIIISTVRSYPEQLSSDDKYNMGLVAQAKRFNVALTRAQSLLIVVGFAAVLGTDQDNWLPFLRYCHEHQSWVGEEWDPLDPPKWHAEHHPTAFSPPSNEDENEEEEEEDEDSGAEYDGDNNHNGNDGDKENYENATDDRNNDDDWQEVDAPSPSRVAEEFSFAYIQRDE